MVVLEKMLLLFAYMLIGFFAGKTKLLKEEFFSGLSTFIVMIGNPALILSSVMGKYQRPPLQVLYQTMGIAIVMFAGLIVIASVLPYFFPMRKEEYGVYKIMCVFSNIGFMGFPVILSLYGKEGLLIGSLFLLPYNILIYTYGILTIQDHAKSHRFSLRKVINPGVIACIATILLFCLKQNVPAPVADFTETIGDMTAPLSMIFIGESMVTCSLKKIVTNRKLFLFLLIKLVAIPAIVIGGMQYIISDQRMLGILLIMLGMPVGSMAVMLAKEYKGNVEVASEGVIFSTLLTILTIPLLFFIFRIS